MPRYKLIQALEKAEISQSGLAALIWAERKAVNRWLRGEAEPRMEYREPIRRALKNNDDPDLFKNYPEGQYPDSVSHAANNCPQVQTSQQLPPPCQTMENRDIVNSADPHAVLIPGTVGGLTKFMELVRRQFIDLMARLGGGALFTNISIGLVPSPHVDPEYYLDLCKGSMGTWWGWLNQGNDHELERALLKHTPILKQLAYTISPFQGMAANLAMQAKIMQIVLANRILDFVESETHCVEAVHLGAISGDWDILATALAWQGNTYTVCYHRPQRAIPILHDALSYLGDGPSVTRSSICSNLSLAYAQDKTQEDFETKARDYAELAHMAMPDYPELDPLYHQFLRWNHSVLGSLEGKAYLYLARHFPDSDYAQKALAVLDGPASDGTREGVRGGALIKKADVVRLLGDMRESVGCLEDGLSISRTKRRMTEASDVIGRFPPEWKQEKSVQELQKEIVHAIRQRSQTIIIARR